MFRNLTPRKDNPVATLDASKRRQDYLNKRQLARIRRNDAPVYGRINWNFSNGTTDQSVAQLVNSAGANLTPTTQVWIDGFASLAAVRPDTFGDVFYELESCNKSVTRSSVKRLLYRAKRVAGVVAGTRLGSLRYSTTSLAQVMDYAGSAIQTTINGSASNNFLPCLFPNGVTLAAGYQWDACLPPMYLQLPSVTGALNYGIVPDISHTSRRRSGRSIASAGAATASLTGLSIDLGESFAVKVYSSHVSTSGTAAPMSVVAGTSIIDEVIYATASGTIVATGGQLNFGYGAYDAATATSSVLTATAGAGTISGASANRTAVTCTASSTPSFGTSTVNFTFTFGADGRITQIDVANAGPNSIVVVLDGGRPSWQSSGAF